MKQLKTATDAAKDFLNVHKNELLTVTVATVLTWWGENKDSYPGVYYGHVEQKVMDSIEFPPDDSNPGSEISDRISCAGSVWKSCENDPAARILIYEYPDKRVPAKMVFTDYNKAIKKARALNKKGRSLELVVFAGRDRAVSVEAWSADYGDGRSYYLYYVEAGPDDGGYTLRYNADSFEMEDNYQAAVNWLSGVLK